VLRVAVRDDGAGGAEFTGGTGLVGLKDRVEALGGTIEIESARGKGTALRATLPIPASSSSLATGSQEDGLVPQSEQRSLVPSRPCPPL
jgi:signal transduction histidine kinase